MAHPTGKSVLTTGFHASTRNRQKRREAELNAPRNTLGHLPHGFMLPDNIPLRRPSDAHHWRPTSSASTCSNATEHEHPPPPIIDSARSSACSELPSMRNLDLDYEPPGGLREVLLHVAALRAYVAPQDGAVGPPAAAAAPAAEPAATRPSSAGAAKRPPTGRVAAVKAARRSIRRPRTRPGSGSSNTTGPSPALSVASPAPSEQAASAHRHGPVNC